MQNNQFSFSTVWNTQKESDGAVICAAIANLGFSNIELNFQFSHEKLAGVFSFLKNNPSIRVSGVHNYCPAPTEDVALPKAFPDCFSIAATDEAERKKAVQYTIRTIETAKKIGGRYVVMHSGHVAMESRMRQLITLAKEGKRDSNEFIRMREDMVHERARRAGEHFDALSTSYGELTKVAKEHGILLGLENRFYYRELPAPDEIKRLLHYFKGNNLGYWHDVGHAAMQEVLGFYRPYEYIGTFHREMIGIHLHDVIQLRDHYMPGTGELDYRTLRTFIRPQIVKTIEIHGHQTADDIRRGMVVLGELFGNKR